MELGNGTGLALACMALFALPLTLDIWRHSAVGAFALILTAIFVLPYRLVRSETVGHVGIADGSPSVATYTALLLVLALGALGSSLINPTRRLLPGSGVMALVGLPIGLAVTWTIDGQEAAGVLALMLGFAAWIVGAFFAPRIFASSTSIRVFAAILLGAVALETLVAALQALGFPLNPIQGDAAGYLGGRANGTFEHPAILGKAIFCLQMLALVLVIESDRRTRQIAWGTIGLGFIAHGLTQGRANIIAAALMLLLWTVLVSRERVSMNIRLAVPLALVLLALPFVGSISSRFQEDPHGGPRDHLLAVAYEQIRETPFVGVGPNDYVSTMAAFDPISAQGFPVHNSFLLITAELGIPFAILFWFPFAMLLLAAWRGRRGTSRQGAFAVVLLAATPGFYIMLSTGWGFMTSPNFPLWCLVLGCFWSFVQPLRTSSEFVQLSGISPPASLAAKSCPTSRA